MRIITFFTVLFLFFGGVSAQNKFFVEFTTSATDLIQFLGERPGVKYVQSDAGIIIANQGSNFVKYSYNEDGNLYKIILFRNFKKKKEAEEQKESILEYQRNRQATLFEEEAEGKDNSKHVAILDGIIDEIYLLKDENTSEYQIKIVRKNPQTTSVPNDNDAVASAIPTI